MPPVKRLVAWLPLMTSSLQPAVLGVVAAVGIDRHVAAQNRRVMGDLARVLGVQDIETDGIGQPLVGNALDVALHDQEVGDGEVLDRIDVDGARRALRARIVVDGDRPHDLVFVVGDRRRRPRRLRQGAVGGAHAQGGGQSRRHPACSNSSSLALPSSFPRAGGTGGFAAGLRDGSASRRTPKNEKQKAFCGVGFATSRASLLRADGA